MTTSHAPNVASNVFGSPTPATLPLAAPAPAPAAATALANAPLPALAAVSRRNGADDLSARLERLAQVMAPDVAAVAAEIAAMSGADRLVQIAARELMATKGKYLRPMCVVLGAKMGQGVNDAVRSLAVAVEMVHNATLLHDDVVDLAPTRRGNPTAAFTYGNAASIFAGDWLLVNALLKINNSNVDHAVVSMLAVIEEMVLAESLQLERRGRFDQAAFAEQAYIAVAQGKTAALFRWAMQIGAKAGNVDAQGQAALARYGNHLGIAFQVIDDCLDFSGTAATLGKVPFADLREGKITHPLLVACERQPQLLVDVAAYLENADDATAAHRIADVVIQCGALQASRAFASAHVAQAIACLDGFAASETKQLLTTVAEASLARSH